MFLSRVFAVVVAALASVSFVSAAPTAEKDVLVKRATEDTVLSVLNSLNSSLAAPIASIGSSTPSGHSLTCTDISPPKDSAVATNAVSMATVGGPCNTIIALLSDASGQIAGLPVGSWDGHGTMPPTYRDCTNALVLIIVVLIPCLGRLVIFISVVPQLVLSLIQIDFCLSTLLICINQVLIDVIITVGGL